MKPGCFSLAFAVLPLLGAGAFPARSGDLATVEQWSLFELGLKGPSSGNPFLEVAFGARFSQGYESIEVAGFYDGSGVYRVRFMPTRMGLWKYETFGNIPELSGKTGEFTVAEASASNHGPVRVTNTFHFAYADGKPYKQLGTTCYAWTHQDESLQEQTLKTLTGSPFNKLRFCVFPKRYSWNTNEPPLYPFAGTPRHFDTTRFNPEFFQHFEKRILELQKLGIEADIILLHPYDAGAWGFDRMTPLEDDRYLRYVIARLAAFRNVWWSLANEYDFMKHKTEQDWERIGELVSRADPFHHLLSIHNGTRLFNHTRPWLTHASIQNGSAVEDPNSAGLYRDAYRKPIVYDEIKYEGNVPKRWGNLSAEELVFRFWNATVAGTYAGHGETYLGSDDVLWWSKGGVLKGQSPARLAFLRQVLEDSPAEGIEPVDKWQNPEYGGKAPDYYLVYLGKSRPAEWIFRLPKPPQGRGLPPAEGMKFKAKILDTWRMTTTPVEGLFTVRKKDDYFYADENGRAIKLPGQPFMALRITRVRE
jgi:hypothetical protein